MENGQYVEGSYWFYAPNKGAPVFFAVAFAASGIFHLWQVLHYKCVRLTGLYVFCAALFVGGFITREIGAFNYGNLIVYIVSICLVYAAPPLYELANYYVLGRILYYVPYLSPLHPGRVLTTFAAISAVVEALSGNGASYVSQAELPESKRNIGKALLKAALIIQICVVGLFVALAAYFHNKCRKHGIHSARINNPLITLYISSAIIATRTIYRIIEYFSLVNVDYTKPGFDPMTMSAIIRYEWFFYVFEATLMLSNSVLLNVRHPRCWLPETNKIYLARDSVTEIEGPGYKEERNFLVTLFDPFDIYGMVTGRDKKTRFWDEDGVPENKNENTNSESASRAPGQEVV